MEAHAVNVLVLVARVRCRYDFSCNPRQAFFYDAYHGSVNTPYPGSTESKYPRLQVGPRFLHAFLKD